MHPSSRRASAPVRRHRSAAHRRPRRSGPDHRAVRIQLGLEERPPVAGCLPNLGDVVPHVVGVHDIGHVGRPGMDSVTMGPRHPVRQTCSPIVADEIDGAVETLELADQPVHVLVLGGPEADRPGYPEARQPQRHRLPSEERLQLPPEPGGLRHAVDEDEHAARVATRHPTGRLDGGIRRP